MHVERSSVHTIASAEKGRNDGVTAVLLFGRLSASRVAVFT
jgi:hypothetical protein